MYPLRVSKPSGATHLEMKRTPRCEPFQEVALERKVVDPLRNIKPCWSTLLEAFATLGDTSPQAPFHVVKAIGP